jgi:TolB-like protein
MRRVLTGVVAAVLACLPLMAAAQVADLKDGVERLAGQLAQSVPTGRVVRVVVTDFPDLQGVTSNLGRYIAERLTTRLSAQQKTFRVIERRRLAQVLSELKFGMSDLVDPAKAKQLGQLLGAEAIVVGTVSDLGNVVDLDARIIEIETSNILPGVSAVISKDETVRRMIDEGRAAPTDSPPSAPPSTGSTVGQARPAARPLGQFTHKCFKVELLDVSVSGSSVRAEFAFTGLLEGAQPYLILDNPDYTYFFDAGGKKYKVASGSAIVGQWLKLPDGVPARHWISFDAADGDLRNGHLFLSVQCQVGTVIATFRSIPIRR